MILGLFILVGIFAGVALIAGTVAAVTRATTRSDTFAVILGTLIIPAFLFVSFGYWVLTMEADGPAPGNVLIGNIMAFAVLTPIALFASRFTIKILSRRATRNVR